MNIEEIRSFVAIVTEGSLGRAAPKLFVSPSALSRRIRDLENGLAVDLFDRTAKGMTLTAAGDQFLVHARRLVAAYNDLQKHASNLATRPSRIRVGIGPAMNVWLRDRLMTIIRTNNRTVVIELVPGSNTGLIRNLQDGEVDLALLHQRPASPQVYSVRILEQATLVALAESLALAHADNLFLRDLRDLPFVTSSTLHSGTPVYYATLRSIFEEAGIDRIIDVGPPDWFAIRDHVVGASGFTIAAISPGTNDPGALWDSATVVRAVSDLDLTLGTFIAWNSTTTNTDGFLWKLVQAVVDEFSASAVGSEATDPRSVCEAGRH